MNPKKENILKTHENGCDDIKQAIESLWPELFESNVIYKAGQRFLHEDGEEYILVKVDQNVVSLIELEDGNRWNKSIHVKDDEDITKSEFNMITDNKSNEFTLKP